MGSILGTWTPGGKRCKARVRLLVAVDVSKQGGSNGKGRRDGASKLLGKEVKRERPAAVSGRKARDSGHACAIARMLVNSDGSRRVDTWVTRRKRGWLCSNQ